MLIIGNEMMPMLRDHHHHRCQLTCPPFIWMLKGESQPVVDGGDLDFRSGEDTPITLPCLCPLRSLGKLRYVVSDEPVVVASVWIGHGNLVSDEVRNWVCVNVIGLFGVGTAKALTVEFNATYDNE